MKLILTLLIAILTSTVAFPHRICGKVIGENQAPPEHVNVILLKKMCALR